MRHRPLLALTVKWLAPLLTKANSCDTDPVAHGRELTVPSAAASRQTLRFTAERMAVGVPVEVAFAASE